MLLVSSPTLASDEDGVVGIDAVCRGIDVRSDGQP